MKTRRREGEREKKKRERERDGGGRDELVTGPLAAMPEWITSDCTSYIGPRHNRSQLLTLPATNVDVSVTLEAAESNRITPVFAT